MPYNADTAYKSWKSHPEWWINQGTEVADITPGKVAWYQSMIPWSSIMPIEDRPNYFPLSNGGVSDYGGVSEVSDVMLPDTGGGGYSGGEEAPALPPITWANKYHAKGAPDWWGGFVPSRYDPQSEYAAMLNSMLPYQSAEDQRYTASILYRMYPDTFAAYNPETQKRMPEIASEMDTDQRRWMTSQQRAKQILSTLDKVRGLMGKDEKSGPGYDYLRQLGSIMRDFGAEKGEGQTRQQYSQMMGALDPLAAETQGSQLSAYSELTRMLTQPYYTAGRVTPTSQLENGQTVFGEPIRNYF